MPIAFSILLLIVGLIVGVIIGFWLGAINVSKEILFRLLWFNYIDLDETEAAAAALKQTPTDSNCKAKSVITIKEARALMSGKRTFF